MNWLIIYALGVTHMFALLIGSYLSDRTTMSNPLEVIAFWLGASALWTLTAIAIVFTNIVKL